MTTKQSVFSLPLWLLVLVAPFCFTSCDKDDQSGQPVRPNLVFYGLTQDNRLQRINAQNSASVESTVTISGLQTGETILGIDFRPNTGQLFGVGSTSRLYVINLQTGAATAVGTAAFTTPISGNTLGFDFNPTVDRIRLVTSTGQNLRLNPENGAIAAVDGAITGAAGASITSVAYTQNRAGATTTVLYDIDIANNKLYKQDPPNNGVLVEVGNLGVDPDGASGFDISPDSANALASLTVGGQNGLYRINLSNGAATKLGDFSTPLIDLAIPTSPTAYAISTANNLLILNPNDGAISFTKPITGLQTGENILGIDMRPISGQLYALGSSSRVYTLNITSGVATAVGAAALTTPLAGTDFGFDFNPVADRIRVISNTGQNLRINPIDGSLVVDGAINPATAVVTAAGYTNSFAGATTTVLYDIDSQTDRLVRQDPPNNGILVDVGALGINIEAANGFDISSVANVAYGIFTVNGTTRLYAVSLTSGQAVLTSSFSQAVRGFALGIGL